jgi:TRAP-type mannitol/chloroaromatic compound transport system permease small subunit
MLLQFRRIYNPIIGLGIIANAVGTSVIFALVTTMNIDVAARNLFNAPLRGVVEVVIFSLILIVFLQLPDVVRSNRLTRSDGFLIFLQNRFPRAADILSRCIDFVAGVFMALIAWTIWPEVTESFGSCHFFTPPEFSAPPTGDFATDLATAFGRCEYFGTPGIFTAPWWPAKLSIGFSVTLCAIIFLFKTILGNTNLNKTGSGEPPL